MPTLTRLSCLLIAGIWLAGLRSSAAEEAGPAAAPLPQSVWNFAAWKLDQVTLRNGKVIEGLIESETANEVRVLEICRPERRGMFAVRRPLAQSDISEMRQISLHERQQSRERFDAFVHRGRVEAVQMENLRLESFEEAGQSGWRYRNEWFTLESHASEELTRVFAMRMQQMFAAYLRVLPPRVSRREDLRIV